MSYRLMLVTLLICTACASSSPLVGYKGDVSISAEDVSLDSKTKLFGEDTIEIIQNRELVNERGDYYLNLILDAYWNQLTGIEPTDNRNNGLLFDITDITIKRGATINFVDPGPVYVMTMKVDIYRDGVFLFDEKYRVKVNMAEIINPDEYFNWLSLSEKQNPDNQITTFNVGLRRLYRNLLFKHLDISLHL